MSLVDINTRIRNLVNNHVLPAVVTAAGKAVAYKGENQRHEDEDAPTEMRLTILPGPQELATIGSPGAQQYRYTGVLVLSLFDSFGEGTNRLELMADAAIDTLRNNSTSGSLTLQAATPVRVGRAGGRWQFNVSCPYKYDRVA